MITYRSPAAARILRQLESACADPAFAEERATHKSEAITCLDSIDEIINADAEMSDDQAGRIAELIIDHWAPRDTSPTLQELVVIATFINSCKAQ